MWWEVADIFWLFQGGKYDPSHDVGFLSKMLIDFKK